jgi:hypothetical protein
MSVKCQLCAVGSQILVGVLVFSQTGLATGLIKATNSNVNKDAVAIVPPVLIPPVSSLSDQKLQLSGGEILSPDGRPVAQLPNPPKEIAGSTYADFPDTTNIVEENVGFVILATIRYSGEKGTIAISTSRPTLAASSLPVSLGDLEVKLNDGTTAWTTIQGAGDLPNRVVFVRNKLIITIAGNLPVDELLGYANQITIK